MLPRLVAVGALLSCAAQVDAVDGVSRREHLERGFSHPLLSELIEGFPMDDYDRSLAVHITTGMERACKDNNGGKYDAADCEQRQVAEWQVAEAYDSISRQVCKATIPQAQ
jgi:hypothetical protein